jgi:hypothetical protein
MPQQSACQKLLTALQEGQQALGLQIFLTILQTAIQEVNRDDTHDSDSQAGSLHADGPSSDVEMSSLSSHFTNTHSDSDNAGVYLSDSDKSQFAGLDKLDSVVDFDELTKALHDEVAKAHVLNAHPPPA